MKVISTDKIIQTVADNAIPVARYVMMISVKSGCLQVHMKA